jgi:hypothetical protein
MPSRSWTRSGTAALWRRLVPERAARAVAASYGADAGAEALLRAFLAERDRDADAVRFRLSVHASLTAPLAPAREG